MRLQPSKTYRRQVARQRYATPLSQASQDGILTVKVDVAGVDKTVAFVKDWKTIEDQALPLNAVLVLCNKNTAYCCEGLDCAHAGPHLKEPRRHHRWPLP